MKHLKVRKVGNSLGVILSKELVETLGVAEGDELTVAADASGRLVVHRREAELDEELRIAREGMARYRTALAELAK